MTATARYDKYGNVVVPVAAGITGASLATTCDPAIAGLLADFKTILNTKLDSAWVAAAGAVAGPHVVMDTFPQEPTHDVINRTWLGPALFVWRADEKIFMRTQVYEDSGVTVKIAYILPSLTFELVQKLAPIRTAVRTTLLGYIKHYGDPTLNSGTALSKYGIESFTFTDARYGYLPAMSELELPFPALDMTAIMRERESYVVSQYPALTEIDTTVTSKDDTGETTVAATKFTP